MKFDQSETTGARNEISEYPLSGVEVAAVSVDITPIAPAPLAGYFRPGNWSSIGERLEGNFLVFFGKEGLFIFGSIDTLFVEDDTVEAIARVLGIGPSRILLVASHTHNAPSLSRSTPLLGEFRPGYEAMVVERICGALVKTIRGGGSRSEFSLGLARGNYNVNRRKPATIADYTTLKKGRLPRIWRGIALSENRNGIVDSNIYVLPVFAGGQIKAVVWSLAAHPAFYPDVHAVSSDFPGTVRRLLREAYGEDVAVLFLPGLAGSAIPRMSRSFPKTVKQFVLRCLPFHQRMRSFSRRTYLDYCMRISRQIISLVDCAGPREALTECILARGSRNDIFRMEDGGSVSLSASKIGLNGNSSLLFLSGEMVGEWNDLLRQRKDQIMTGYAPGRPIYVPTVEQLGEGGYEADKFKAHFSLCGDFISGYRDSIVAAVRRLDSSL